MSGLLELQADALRELCNICGGYAATALSRLLGNVRVDLDLPEAARVPPEHVEGLLGDASARVVGVHLDLSGPVQGRLMLVLAEPAAEQLASAVNRTGQDELHSSALGEAANIIASACLNALYALTRLTVLPGQPQMVRGTARDVLRPLLSSSDGQVVVLTTTLHVAGSSMGGRILVIPDEVSLRGLLMALGVA
jgi:chemotaxis protein CheC